MLNIVEVTQQCRANSFDFDEKIRDFAKFIKALYSSMLWKQKAFHCSCEEGDGFFSTICYQLFGMRAENIIDACALTEGAASLAVAVIFFPGGR